ENPIASSPINAITTVSEPVTPSTDFGPSIWMLLYLLGASGGLLRLCYRLAQVRGLVRRGHRTTTRGMTIIESTQVQQTASFLHVLFCANKAQLLAQPYVFEHEQSHYRQGHTWDRLWLELWSIVNWFNPLMYFYKRDLQLLHEYLADKKVVLETKDLYGYAEFLAGKNRGKGLYLVNTFSSHIKSRLMMLSRNHTDKKKARFYLLLLPLLALMLMANGRQNIPSSSASEPTLEYYLDWGGFTIPFDGDRQIDVDIEINRLTKLQTKLPRLREQQSLDVTGEGAVLVLMRGGRGWLECELPNINNKEAQASCITEMLQAAEAEDVLYIHNLSSTDHLRFSVALRLRKPSLQVDAEGQGLVEKSLALDEIDFSTIVGIDDTPMIVLEPIAGTYKASNVWTNDRIHMLWGDQKSHPAKELDIEQLRQFYQKPLSVVMGGKVYPVVSLQAKIKSEQVDLSFSGRRLAGPQFDRVIGLLDEPTTIYFPYVFIDLKENGKLMRFAIPDLLRYNFKKAL
ncbi:MAG: M56 family metallopeptidase, partial [Saprospiraceae bacterium]|nr:M56 family metallopeptidase [Saprospiraceae bacterium]